MWKRRTVAVERSEVDFMVLEFACRDSSVLASLGQHCKETRWKVAAGIDAQPFDIAVTVDRKVLQSPEVSITWNGQRIFPASGGAAKTKLREDFSYRAPFRGTLKGLCEKNYYEVRPERIAGDQWFPATLTEQREDCRFKATVLMPDGKGGFTEVDFPAVKVEHIREMSGMKKPAVIPQKTLVLQVPAKDPLHAILKVDDGEPLTHFFARPSPPPNSSGGQTKPKLTFQVSKDRQLITTSVGHSVLEHFLMGDARLLKHAGSRLKHSWAIMVGPFAEHTIEVEKKHAQSKVVTLTVDGQVLCESAAEDIGCNDRHWECCFCLTGEKVMEWEVYETDVDGNSLDTQGLVTQKFKYSHECIVSLEDGDKDMTAARLSVDLRNFTDLAEYRQLASDSPLRCSPEALNASYGLLAPWKVNESVVPPLFSQLAVAGTRLMENSISIPNASSFSTDWLSFGKCCARSSAGTDELVIPH